MEISEGFVPGPDQDGIKRDLCAQLAKVAEKETNTDNDLEIEILYDAEIQKVSWNEKDQFEINEN